MHAGHTRVVMGRPRARICACARAAMGLRSASVICILFCSSLAVWRAGVNTKTRDYRTFAGAHCAQSTCVPAHQRARKQAPQLVAQWLLRFSHTVSPRSSHTRPSSAHGRRACVQGAAPVARQHPRAPVDHWSSGPSCSCWPARCPGCCPPALRPATATPSAHRRYNRFPVCRSKVCHLSQWPFLIVTETGKKLRYLVGKAGRGARPGIGPRHKKQT